MKLRSVLMVCALAWNAPAQFRVPKIPKVPGGGAERGGSSGTPGSGVLGGGGRVKAELDQAERALDGCDRQIKKQDAAACAPYHAKFDDSIADAQKAIQGASIAGAADYLTRIKDLKARRDEQAAAMGVAGDKSAATNAKFTGADAEKDKITIEALRHFYDHFHSLHTPPNEAKLQVIEQWPRVKIDVERLLQQYPAPKSRQGVANEGHDLIVKVRLLDRDHKNALASIDKTIADMPRLLKLELDLARERLTRAETNGMVATGLSTRQQLDNAEMLLKEYAILGQGHPKFDPAFPSTAREDIKSVTALLDRLTDKVIAENELPPDNYTGADAEALKASIRAAWSSQRPNLKVLKVGLNGNWNRTAGWKWEDIQSSWIKFDSSRLGGYVVFDLGHAKHVYLRTAAVRKDHLNGGRTEASVAWYDPSDKPDPLSTFLRERLK